MNPAFRIFAFVYTAAGSFGMLSNIIQLILIYRNQKPTNSAFALSLVSLNIADLLASTSFAVAGCVFFAGMFNAVDKSLYRCLTHLLTAAIVFSLTLSFTHVAFIAIQRVIGVVAPFEAKQIITKTRSLIVLVILWFISLLLALIRYYIIKISVVLSLLAIITGVVLIIMYSVISYKTMKRDILRNVNADMRRRCQQTDREVMLYSIAITVIFVICNFPVAIKNFVEYPGIVHLISNVLFVLNPFLDTFLYFVWSYYKRRRQAKTNEIPSEEVNLTARTNETSL